MSGETLGPLLRKMAAYTSTENHKRPPPPPSLPTERILILEEPNSV